MKRSVFFKQLLPVSVQSHGVCSSERVLVSVPPPPQDAPRHPAPSRCGNMIVMVSKTQHVNDITSCADWQHYREGMQGG
jgi:hypothetical protein